VVLAVDREVDGKNVTRRCDCSGARHCQEWIRNDHRVRALLGQMRTAAAKATALILREEAVR